MAITPQGGTTGTAVEVETNTRAERTVVHGSDWQCYGSYAAAAALAFSSYGGIGFNNSSLWQFRVANNVALNHMVAVRRVVLNMYFATSPAAGAWVWQLFIVRNTTANGTGATALTFTGANGKLRTTMNPQLLADLRLGTANAALGVITGTQDAMPIASCTVMQPSAAEGSVGSPFTTLFEARVGECPILLAAGEALSLNLTTPSNASASSIGVNVAYDELVVY